MCLKYSISSLKAQSNDANYRTLAKILKFSTTKNAMCMKTINKTLLGLQCGLKGKGKIVDKCFGLCGANGQKDYGATNNEPNNLEKH